MSTPAPVRVLLADDQDLVRGGLRVILESEPGLEVVGEAGDGRAAVEQTLELAPDVVCMDVQMPVLDGLQAIRELVARGSRAHILVLTTFNRDDYLFEALAAGPAASCSKPPPPNSSSKPCRYSPAATLCCPPT